MVGRGAIQAYMKLVWAATFCSLLCILCLLSLGSIGCTGACTIVNLCTNGYMQLITFTIKRIRSLHLQVFLCENLHPSIPGMKRPAFKSLLKSCFRLILLLFQTEKLGDDVIILVGIASSGKKPKIPSDLVAYSQDCPYVLIKF